MDEMDLWDIWWVDVMEIGHESDTAEICMINAVEANLGGSNVKGPIFDV